MSGLKLALLLNSDNSSHQTYGNRLISFTVKEPFTQSKQSDSLPEPKAKSPKIKVEDKQNWFASTSEDKATEASPRCTSSEPTPPAPCKKESPCTNELSDAEGEPETFSEIPKIEDKKPVTDTNQPTIGPKQTKPPRPKAKRTTLRQARARRIAAPGLIKTEPQDVSPKAQTAPTRNGRQAPRGQVRRPRHKTWPCEKAGCTEIFTNKRLYERHLSRDHKLKSTSCPLCGKNLGRRDYMTDHIRSRRHLKALEELRNSKSK